ncbi:uncharacterized protein BX663DRAFT_501116 [Cokeromyces recurvatus]|uniref:uncharacterized protein n=1 Tax=Cokeromyces recurvatus TaxID=90255 RepID=UPI00221E90CC|nr:uncharacterized protein BX663DRAFT_501116 [Cokeromyces recurvatus]KAI7904946.1 hypothetical protein BX663DRAFT_501116 [Cokeromyces recurvatus]
MFNQQQKPAFKFVIRSKIEETSSSSSSIDKQVDNTNDDTKQSLLEDRKRKRIETGNNAPPIATKKIHSQLERWNRKKEELKKEREAEEEEEKAKKNFADLKSLICILCQRKFKSKQDLEKHQQVSELHKNNLNDPVAINKAKMKMDFMKSEQEEHQQLQTVEYRNRAAERRQAYGQPEKPILTTPLSPPRPLTKSHELETLPKASVYAPISDDNKGARMLANMGWKKGEGLGKHGTGILNPIKAESYAQSAGIGASTKRDVSLNDSYRDRTLDLVSVCVCVCVCV